MGCIVITGASGYIGSALAGRLSQQGHAVRLVSRNLAALGSLCGRARVECMSGNLSDAEVWQEVLRDADCVVHLSWRTGLRAAEANPAEDEVLNVRPIRALIESAGRLRKRPIAVVFASTSTIVGDVHDLPVTESTPDRPISVYDRHKLMCEKLLADATSAGVVAACTLRLSNVYGRGRASVNGDRGILNLMIRRAVSGEPIVVYGDGKYLRDFVHLSDVVDAFEKAIATPAARDGKSYVIASGVGRTIAEVFTRVAKDASGLLGTKVELVFASEPKDLHPIERRNFVGRSDLFCARTGWKPRMHLEDAINDDLQFAFAEHSSKEISGSRVT